VERYEDLQAQKELFELDRDRIEGVLDDLPGTGIPILVLERIPAVQQSSELMGALEELGTRRDSVRTLLQRYTEEFPDVREQNEFIETLERVFIPSLLGEIVRDLSAEVRSLDDRIGSTARELREVPTRMAIEDSLESIVQQREERAAEIGRRLEVQKLEFSGSLEDFQILNPATPPLDPSSDQRLPLAGAIFLGFLGAGLAGAVLLDRFDTRFRYPEDLTHGIGVEVLGMVPRIRGKKTEGEVEEAFRDLRMRLMYAHGTAGPLMVTFASPGPSEGKTLVTANLGLAFAKIGRRTLLIDGDTRRGDLHRLIGGQRSPGLVDFLSGTSDGRIIHRTEYPNLHFMGAGARLARAPELLAGERIQQLFARLRERYDVILVDGPPLAVGADSFHLASIAGSMALVVRAGESEKAIVERKLQALSNLPVRVLGGILNDVASSALKGYGYYSYYVPGYESGSEDQDEVSRLGPGESQDVHIPD
jgi:capsular exopolysaccharide synthesis family protein